MSSSKLNVKTNNLPGSRLAVELEIPSNQCKSSYEETLSQLSRSASLPGFRKGKVPRTVLIQQLGQKRIQASALEKLLGSTWDQIKKQESIQALSEPELVGGFEKVLENFDPNKNLSITLETDIPPTPKLKITKGLNAEVEKVPFDPKRVDEIIEKSQKQLATLVPIENRNAKNGDIAVVSFKGTFNDDKTIIEGGSSDSMDVELIEGQMIPGFIEGVIDMKIGETKVVECSFPKDYAQEKAQGRKANFEITLKELKTRELPQLDDSFAKQTSEKSTMEELRNDLEKRLKEETKLQNEKNKQEALLQSIVNELEIELPKTLIDLEIRNIIEQTARTFAQQGIDVKSTFTPDLVNKLMESSRPEAESNLKKQFAISALAEQENIEVNDTELKEKLTEVKKQLEKEKNIDQEKLKEAVIADLLEKKVFTWLEENNNVIEKTKKKEGKPSKSSKTKGEKTKTDKSS